MSLKLFSAAAIERYLSEPELLGVAADLYEKCTGTKVPHWWFQLRDENEILLNQVPGERIIKMTKRIHLDGFLSDGTLQLGTAIYYAGHENPEVGDPMESAPIVLIGERLGYTQAVAVQGGLDHFLFCAALGEPDEEIMRNFGYDACYEVTQPAAFAAAVQDALDAQGGAFGRCLYTPYRALRGAISEQASLMRIDHRLMDMLGSARNFLKPKRFEGQREFRFTWKMPAEKHGTLLIKCPEAIAFIRPL